MYIIKLKLFSEDSAFGKCLEQMLRDQIVCEIKTYKSAFELAQSMKTAYQKPIFL